jgi:hypothetical protein
VRAFAALLLVSFTLTACQGGSEPVEIQGPPKFGSYDQLLWLTRPLARRRPSTEERRAIVEAARRDHRLVGHDICIRYSVDVSTINPNWARVLYRFVKPYTKDCLLGNGWSMLQKQEGRWHLKGDASDGFPCDYGPPGVIAGLDGACAVFLERRSVPNKSTIKSMKAVLAGSRSVQALGRTRLKVDNMWLSQTGSFAAASLSSIRFTESFSRDVLLALRGGKWRVLTVRGQADWCRYAPPAVLREIHLADSHC